MTYISSHSASVFLLYFIRTTKPFVMPRTYNTMLLLYLTRCTEQFVMKPYTIENHVNYYRTPWKCTRASYDSYVIDNFARVSTRACRPENPISVELRPENHPLIPPANRTFLHKRHGTGTLHCAIPAPFCVDTPTHRRPSSPSGRLALRVKLR